MFLEIIKPHERIRAAAGGHALWNGFSSKLIGEDLTTQLTNAHELAPNDKPFAWKEKEMDLFNNEKGRIDSRFSDITNIFTNILLQHQNGNLRYLDNLQPNEPVIGHATIFSNLTPTNQ